MRYFTRTAFYVILMSALVFLLKNKLPQISRTAITSTSTRSVFNTVTAKMATSTTTSTSASTASTTSALPALSPQDFKLYNRLAEEMTFYHGMLRRSWDELYTGSSPSAKKPSAKKLIDVGLHFCRHLKGHHDIEEAYWFPRLGKKMEGFRPGHFAQEQHKEMHKGLDVLQEYLEECARGEQELRREEVRRIMDDLGRILWKHMDEEVEELGADNMRRYWTKEEMRRLPY